MPTDSAQCPVCSGKNNPTLHRQQFVLPAGHPLQSGYDVCVCNQCGLVFADTHVEQEAYDAYYANQSIYASTVSSGNSESPWDRARHAETVEFFVTSQVPKSASIVDVGCANGGLLLALKAQHYEHTLGVDPSAACVQSVRDQALRAEVGSLDEKLAAIGEHDVVTLIGVLEHVQDLHRALACVAPCIKPGGLLFAEVPDATRYPEFLVAPFQDFNTEHIRHFSPRTLELLLALNGFESSGVSPRVIEQAPRVRYPAIRGFFRKGATPATPVIKRDPVLPASIEKYIQASAQLMAKIDVFLAATIAKTPKVWVWGTGQLLMKLLGETSLKRADILGFVDANPVNHGLLLNGKPIVGPDSLTGTTEPILITSLIHQRVIAETIRTKLKLQNEVVLLPDDHIRRE